MQVTIIADKSAYVRNTQIPNSVFHLILLFSVSPAFNTVNVQALAPVFLQKSRQLRDVWVAKLQEAGSKEGKTSDVIQVVSWLNRYVFFLEIS